MSTFDSTKTPLGQLLEDVVKGKIQLPEFQRGWVWDDEHIRSLLVSIARSFPIGAVMLLKTGGETRFQIRPIEGVELPKESSSLAEQLILDGQQRLTSLTQVLKLKTPVATRDEKKRELQLFYYFDIEAALRGPNVLGDAVLAVREDKMLRSNFGRTVDLDLSTTEREISAFHFPCNEILDSSKWEYALMNQDLAKMPKFMEFRRQVLEPFRSYMLPVIALERHTSKEAVCLVFGKVNTAGVPLSVFELVTATWAAEGFNLRADWFGAAKKEEARVPERSRRAGPADSGRHVRLAKRPLLKALEPTDFLQGISLLHSFERRRKDLEEKHAGKDVAAVTAKREYILDMPLTAYQKWADPLALGFEEADNFLRAEGFHKPEYLPYRSQIVPLAAVLTLLRERWREPQIRTKLARWFWCGVLGELYGGAIETRIALDLQGLFAWITEPDAPEPVTVQAAGFQPNRLDTLRSRTSAAYRGLYVLLQREGARDFFWSGRMVELELNERRQIDIHHIFPRKWCEAHEIPRKVYDSIVNKTAISYKANRMIGGKAPSAYLSQIQSHAQAKLPDTEMNEILGTHLIEPTLLRADNFDAFYQARKSELLRVISRAMGKPVVDASEAVPEDDEMEDDVEAEDGADEPAQVR